MPVKNTTKSRKLTAADLKKITGGASASVKGISKSGRPSLSGKSSIRSPSTSSRGH